MALSLRVNTAQPDRHLIRVQTPQGILTIRARQRPGSGANQVMLDFDGPREIFTILRGDGEGEGGGGNGRTDQPDSTGEAVGADRGG